MTKFLSHHFTRHYLLPGVFILLILCITALPTSAHGIGKVAEHTISLNPTPPCQSTNCLSIDPYSSHCGTATSYNKISIVSNPITEDTGVSIITLGYTYNYYSPWCIANWVEVSLSGAYGVRIWISTTDGSGHKENMCYPDNCTDYYDGASFPSWTNMVDGTNITDACSSVPASGGGFVCVDQ